MGEPLTGAERQKRYRDRHPEYREREVIRGRKRVFVGRFYVGTTRRASSAAILNELIRREFRDRKNQSRA